MIIWFYIHMNIIIELYNYIFDKIGYKITLTQNKKFFFFKL